MVLDKRPRAPQALVALRRVSEYAQKSFSHTQSLFLPCNASIGVATAVDCVVEFNHTIRALNIVRLSKTCVLCALLAGPFVCLSLLGLTGLGCHR